MSVLSSHGLSNAHDLFLMPATITVDIFHAKISLPWSCKKALSHDNSKDWCEDDVAVALWVIVLNW